MAGTVHGRGINPVDTQFQGSHDGRNGIVIFLISPTEFPPASADGPGAKTDARYIQVGITGLASLHLVAPKTE